MLVAVDTSLPAPSLRYPWEEMVLGGAAERVWASQQRKRMTAGTTQRDDFMTTSVSSELRAVRNRGVSSI